MNKRIRNFFTLTRKANDGFTLVELIVVIAILAILGGVAIPAYSGYIQRAERAGDEALLSEINTAFAAACAFNGENNYFRTDITATNAKIENAKFVYAGPFADDFASFFEGEATEFKVITGVIYDAGFGGFVDPATAESMTIAYGGGFVQVTGEAVNALLNSTYYGEGMTSEKLMNQIDRVAGVAGIMGSVTSVKNTDGFADATLIALGITPTGTLADKQAVLQAKARELALEQLGWTEADVTSDNQYQLFEKMQEIENNALVLYTAQSTTQLGTEGAKELLNGVNSTMIKDAMDGKLTEADKAKGMNQAALAYGMYYAYVNSDQCTDTTLKKDDIGATDVIAALDSNEEFRTYMNSEQGTKDMAAYLQALSVINSSSQSPEAVEKLVSEGFASEDLINILTQSMGK